MKSASIVIDQSTTASKVYLIDETGTILDACSKTHNKYYPDQGWVEHDPQQIWEQVHECIRRLVLAHGDEMKFVRASITNQRETVVAWNKETGKPVCNAIVWQCARTNDLCRKMIREGHEPFVLQRTGLKIDPYFSATKMKWILDHCEVDRQKVRFGTIDSWLIYKLTNGKVHATDHTNASRTLLYGLESETWDDELCTLFGIERSMLPDILCSDDVFGWTDLNGLLKELIPIQGVMGDSQAAFYAQRCVHEGDIKMTLGTGSSIMMNSSKRQPGIDGLVNVLGYKMKESRAYGVEGIVNCNGESLNWAKEDMRWFFDYDELNEDLFERSSSVLFVPALTGLSMPYWNPAAQGIFIGVGRQSRREDFLLAVIHGVICQLCDALACFGSAGMPVRVDGGLSRNKFIMQLLADLSGRTIEVCEHPDLSAMGVWLAGSGKNDFKRKTNTLYPKRPDAWRQAQLERYHRAIDCVLMLTNVKKEETEDETKI